MAINTVDEVFAKRQTSQQRRARQIYARKRARRGGKRLVQRRLSPKAKRAAKLRGKMMKRTGLAKKISRFHASHDLPATIHESTTLKHHREFIAAVNSAAVEFRKLEGVTEEDARDFAMHFLTKEPVYSNTSTGAAALLYEIELEEKLNNLAQNLVETIVDPSSKSFLIVFDRRIGQKEFEQMEEQMDDRADFDLLVNAGQRDDQGQVSDIAIIEAFPKGNPEAELKDNARYKRAAGYQTGAEKKAALPAQGPTDRTTANNESLSHGAFRVLYPDAKINESQRIANVNGELWEYDDEQNLWSPVVEHDEVHGTVAVPNEHGGTDYVPADQLVERPLEEAVKVKKLGSSYSVTIPAATVRDWKDNWPGSRLPVKNITFTFNSKNGDLEDIEPSNIDGEDVVALSHDAGYIGAKKLGLTQAANHNKKHSDPDSAEVLEGIDEARFSKGDRVATTDRILAGAKGYIAKGTKGTVVSYERMDSPKGMMLKVEFDNGITTTPDQKYVRKIKESTDTNEDKMAIRNAAKKQWMAADKSKRAKWIKQANKKYASKVSLEQARWSWKDLDADVQNYMIGQVEESKGSDQLYLENEIDFRSSYCSWVATKGVNTEITLYSAEGLIERYTVEHSEDDIREVLDRAAETYEGLPAEFDTMVEAFLRELCGNEGIAEGTRRELDEAKRDGRGAFIQARDRAVAENNRMRRLALGIDTVEEGKQDGKWAKSEATRRLKDNARLYKKVGDKAMWQEWAYSPKTGAVGMRTDPDGDYRIVNTKYPMYGKADQVKDWKSVGSAGPEESVEEGKAHPRHADTLDGPGGSGPTGKGKLVGYWQDLAGYYDFGGRMWSVKPGSSRFVGMNYDTDKFIADMKAGKARVRGKLVESVEEAMKFKVGQGVHTPDGIPGVVKKVSGNQITVKDKDGATTVYTASSLTRQRMPAGMRESYKQKHRTTPATLWRDSTLKQQSDILKKLKLSGHGVTANADYSKIMSAAMQAGKLPKLEQELMKLKEAFVEIDTVSIGEEGEFNKAKAMKGRFGLFRWLNVQGDRKLAKKGTLDALNKWAQQQGMEWVSDPDSLFGGHWRKGNIAYTFDITEDTDPDDYPELSEGSWTAQADKKYEKLWNSMDANDRAMMLKRLKKAGAKIGPDRDALEDWSDIGFNTKQAFVSDYMRGEMRKKIKGHKGPMLPKSESAAVDEGIKKGDKVRIKSDAKFDADYLKRAELTSSPAGKTGTVLVAYPARGGNKPKLAVKFDKPEKGPNGQIVRSVMVGVTQVEVEESLTNDTGEDVTQSVGDLNGLISKWAEQYEAEIEEAQGDDWAVKLRCKTEDDAKELVAGTPDYIANGAVRREGRYVMFKNVEGFSVTVPTIEQGETATLSRRGAFESVPDSFLEAVSPEQKALTKRIKALAKKIGLKRVSVRGSSGKSDYIRLMPLGKFKEAETIPEEFRIRINKLLHNDATATRGNVAAFGVTLSVGDWKKVLDDYKIAEAVEEAAYEEYSKHPKSQQALQAWAHEMTDKERLAAMKKWGVTDEIIKDIKKLHPAKKGMNSLGSFGAFGVVFSDIMHSVSRAQANAFLSDVAKKAKTESVEEKAKPKLWVKLARESDGWYVVTEKGTRLSKKPHKDKKSAIRQAVAYVKEKQNDGERVEILSRKDEDLDGIDYTLISDTQERALVRYIDSVSTAHGNKVVEFVVEAVTPAEIAAESQRIDEGRYDGAVSKGGLGEAEPLEPMQKHYDRWVKRGNVFSVSGPLDVKENITRSAYRLQYGMGTIDFIRVQPKTDELYRYESSVIETVLAEVDRFWDLKEKYDDIGLRHTRGVLMYGPPGCGKSCAIQQMTEMIVGRGDVVFFADNVGVLRRGLKEFREVEPDRKVVVVLEDMDEYIGRDEREMLQLLDGDNAQESVLFLGTTNYAERFPPRLLRSGRFDKKIYVGPPEENAREAYLTNKLKETDKKTIKKLVQDSEGMNFGDLKELVVATHVFKENPTEAVKRIRGAALQESTSEAEQLALLEAEIDEENTKRVPAHMVREGDVVMHKTTHKKVRVTNVNTTNLTRGGKTTSMSFETLDGSRMSSSAARKTYKPGDNFVVYPDEYEKPDEAIDEQEDPPENPKQPAESGAGKYTGLKSAYKVKVQFEDETTARKAFKALNPVSLAVEFEPEHTVVATSRRESAGEAKTAVLDYLREKGFTIEESAIDTESIDEAKLKHYAVTIKGKEHTAQPSKDGKAYDLFLKGEFVKKVKPDKESQRLRPGDLGAAVYLTLSKKYGPDSVRRDKQSEKFESMDEAVEAAIHVNGKDAISKLDKKATTKALSKLADRYNGEFASKPHWSDTLVAMNFEFDDVGEADRFLSAISRSSDPALKALVKARPKMGSEEMDENLIESQMVKDYFDFDKMAGGYSKSMGKHTDDARKVSNHPTILAISKKLRLIWGKLEREPDRKKRMEMVRAQMGPKLARYMKSESVEEARNYKVRVEVYGEQSTSDIEGKLEGEARKGRAQIHWATEPIHNRTVITFAFKDEKDANKFRAYASKTVKSLKGVKVAESQMDEGPFVIGKRDSGATTDQERHTHQALQQGNEKMRKSNRTRRNDKGLHVDAFGANANTSYATSFEAVDDDKISEAARKSLKKLAGMSAGRARKTGPRSTGKSMKQIDWSNGNYSEALEEWLDSISEIGKHAAIAIIEAVRSLAIANSTDDPDDIVSIATEHLATDEAKRIMGTMNGGERYMLVRALGIDTDGIEEYVGSPRKAPDYRKATKEDRSSCKACSHSEWGQWCSLYSFKYDDGYTCNDYS